MSATANLRRQHDAAGVIVSDILALEDAMDGAPSDGEAFKLTMLLAKLAGTLRIHLAQEDRHLYPSLMASAQGGAAATAREFFEEMGQLAPVLDAFVQKWRNPEAMAAQWATYRTEQDAVFGALLDRIRRENEILYPLADKVAFEGRSANAA